MPRCRHSWPGAGIEEPSLAFVLRNFSLIAEFMIPEAFLAALPAEGPSPDLAHTDNIFGFLIGSWEVDAVFYDSKGDMQKTKGEVHASGFWRVEQFKICSSFHVAQIGIRGFHLRATVMAPPLGPPASTLVVVKQLFRPELLVEVDAIAVTKA
jgi:hypothetical protein